MSCAIIKTLRILQPVIVMFLNSVPDLMKTACFVHAIENLILCFVYYRIIVPDILRYTMRGERTGGKMAAERREYKQGCLILVSGNSV
jgi:hypothetical protein